MLNPVNYLNRSDNVSGNTETEKSVDHGILEAQSGWDRLKEMFEIDEFGNVSVPLNSVLQVGAMSMFVGILYGGFMNSRTAYTDFIKNNQATTFANHIEAKKKLQDKVTISFGKGAFKWGWRLTGFCTAYAGISTVISVYRGKSGVTEHLIAGCVTGAGYKFNMGPRGWIVGGGLGLVLGTICGLCTVGYSKLTGLSVEDARYWQYHWQHARSESFRKDVNEHSEKKRNSVFRYYNAKNEQDPKSLDDVE